MTVTSGAIIISCLLTVFTVSCEPPDQDDGKNIVIGMTIILGAIFYLLVVFLRRLITPSVAPAPPELNTIDDLKDIYFKGSVPKHTLLLLHWFANTVDIKNDVVNLSFDQNTEFGSHYYNNAERILPQGSRYYTVGNLYQPTSDQLPEYVRKPQFMQYKGNRDRIIFSVQRQTAIIDRVYITEHHKYKFLGSAYNRKHTYEISTNLLQAIQLFSIKKPQTDLSVLGNKFGKEINNNVLCNISNTWTDHAPLALLLIIVTGDQNLQYGTRQ